MTTDIITENNAYIVLKSCGNRGALPIIKALEDTKQFAMLDRLVSTQERYTRSSKAKLT